MPARHRPRPAPSSPSSLYGPSGPPCKPAACAEAPSPPPPRERWEEAPESGVGPPPLARREAAGLPPPPAAAAATAASARALVAACLEFPPRLGAPRSRAAALLPRRAPALEAPGVAVARG